MSIVYHYKLSLKFRSKEVFRIFKWPLYSGQGQLLALNEKKKKEKQDNKALTNW